LAILVWHLLLFANSQMQMQRKNMAIPKGLAFLTWQLPSGPGQILVLASFCPVAIFREGRTTSFSRGNPMVAQTLFGARTPSDEGNDAKETWSRAGLTQENRLQAFAKAKPNSQICQGEPLKCQVY